MPLALSIPAERHAPPKDLEIRPRQVKAWIESIPLAQSLDAGRQLCAHLAAMNRSRFDLEVRLQILEIYRPIALVLLEELDHVYSKATVPLATRARESLTLARDLAAELATGYKIALAEKTGKLIAFGAKKQMPLLVVRIMQYLCAGLRASYKSYSPAPPGIWAEMHQLYLHAEQEGIVAEPGDPEAKTSVAEIYCEALLLSLTDPYRLSQGDCDKVVVQIRAMRAPVTLSRVRPDTRPGGHFIVPCDTDRPPKPALSANDDTGGANWRLLDANPLVEKLRMKKNALDTGNVSATMSKAVGPDVMALMAKLIVLWGDPPKRASRRDPSQATVAICVGMNAIGHYLEQEPRQDALAQAEGLRRGITMPLAPLPSDDASEAVPVFEWEVVNQSAGGLKVRRIGPSQPVAVGEVVGMKLVDRARWTIAVVRWITVFDEGGMEFGVQFLALGARMVSLQPTAASQANQARLGLLLADEDDPAHSDVLLAPPNTYSDLREFEIEDAGEVSRVRATSLIEKTGRFELFHIAPS